MNDLEEAKQLKYCTEVIMKLINNGKADGCLNIDPWLVGWDRALETLYDTEIEKVKQLKGNVEKGCVREMLVRFEGNEGRSVTAYCGSMNIICKDCQETLDILKEILK